MMNTILCSSNPMLVKSVYAILRDEGHAVETTDHPAFAVQMIMRHHYDFLVIDSEPFGLSAEDAAAIVKTIAPGVRIVYVGSGFDGHSGRTETPLDLEAFKKTIQGIAV